MQQINKYFIDQSARRVIVMSKDSGPFTVMTINGIPYIYAVVDDDKEIEKYYFEVYKTDEEITEIDWNIYPNGRRYVGSFIHNGDGCHVFQLRKEGQ